jgi:hypothetical protein
MAISRLCDTTLHCCPAIPKKDCLFGRLDLIVWVARAKISRLKDPENPLVSTFVSRLVGASYRDASVYHQVWKPAVVRN